jgi:GR25 family glycosyltransferase involved in LPS biosynthesis
MIFEDDVVVREPHWREKLAGLSWLGDEEHGWDMVFFDVMRREAFIPVTPDVSKLGLFWGMHAYLLTRSAAQKLIALVESAPIDRQVDGFIHEHRNKLTLLSVSKGWFRQDEARFGTDVQLIYHSHLAN